MRCITEQGEATRPNTANKFAKKDAERDNHSELEFLLQMCLVVVRVRLAVRVMRVVTVVVQKSVSL